MTGTSADPGTDKNQERDEETVEGQRCGGCRVEGVGWGAECQSYQPFQRDTPLPACRTEMGAGVPWCVAGRACDPHDLDRKALAPVTWESPA